LLGRERADADLAEEWRQIVDEASWTTVAGDELRAREHVRDAGWEESVRIAIADVAYAVRRLRRDVSFTIVAVTTLALGIGATTAIFSTVNPVLFRPLPYPDARRIVAIADRRPDGAPVDVTFGTYRELLARTRVFEAMSVFKPWQPAWSGDGAPERLLGQRVSFAYFAVFGVRPALGREFESSDDRRGAADVVVISDRLWRRRFGGDPGIIGHQLRLDGKPQAVIGVMPAGFRTVQAPEADVWAPLGYDPALPPDGREWGHHLKLIARLRADVGSAAAAAELDGIAARRMAEFSRVPWASLAGGLSLVTLQDEVVRGVRPALVTVMGAVLLLLVAACVNVANLLLARGAQQRGELAVRAAIGAGRARLVGQLVTESVVVSLAGGAAGVVVAAAGVRALIALAPPTLPRVDAVHFDATALAFACGVSAIVGLLVGAVPAWYATARDLNAMLPHAARQTRSSHGPRRALVIAEITVALVLLVVTGLLLRSLHQLFAVDPGFAVAHVLTLQVDATSQSADPAATRPFFDRVLERVQHLPGVESAAWTSQLPLTGDFDKYGATIDGPPSGGPADDHSALRYAVTPGYFDAMGIGARRGRLIDGRDRQGTPVAVVVSEAFVRHRLGHVDPIGRRLHLGRTDAPWFTIVGVVGDVKQTSLAVGDADAVYIAEDQWSFPDTVRSLVVRSSIEPASLASSIRSAIWSVDPDVPIVRVATFEALVDASAAARRFLLLVFEAFAIVALLLAATGLYGVMAGSVTERLRELGVRAALGATRGRLLTDVLVQGLLLSVAGLAIGLMAAIGASRAVESMLFGISPLDGVTYGGVALLLVAVSAAASGLPAWRAAHVDPATLLRAD
jgi:putative ABC transport system permease protein